MKRCLFILIIGLVTFSCQEKESRTDYVINGSAPGVYNGIRVYLGELNPRGQFTAKDTAIIINEAFSFSGSVDYPKAHVIMMNGTSGRLPFMLENSEISIDIDKSEIRSSAITGSESHAIMDDYSNQMSKYREQINNLNRQYIEASKSNNSDAMDNTRKELGVVTDEAKQFPYQFIDEHKGRMAILQIFSMQLQQPNADIVKLSNAFNTIDVEVRNSNLGKEIESKFGLLLGKLEREKATAIGAKAPTFSAPNPDGKQVALADVVSKGKVTIVDFWAAWCGPCRRENPNVVKVYEEFHDKGLEIIGVSLDGRRGQKEPKQAWIDAIEKDGLTWYQVSNLNYFDEIAQTYNVNAIPAMFVLDENGVIIAKNLRGPALGNKIRELLNE